MNKKKAVIPQLVLLELNEINFELVKWYVDKYPLRFRNFKSLLACKMIHTVAEQKYEELEPWIQWASVHTGKTYEEHKIYRLGDIVSSKIPQLFEILEKKGFSVGAISAMNADNRLQNPAFFIPDPWTKTRSDRSMWSRALSKSVSQAVNDNSSSKLTLETVAIITLAFLRFFSVKNLNIYLSLVSRSVRGSWRKALFLDMFLHDLHLKLLKAKKPQFSTLFLNAGAHIQHHYFFNSEALNEKQTIRNPTWYIEKSVDPFAEMLETYDKIVGDYYRIENLEIILATGLSQVPYDRLKYYYRLKDHNNFLNKLQIKYKNVLPRMTRDFLIQFNSSEEATIAMQVLRSVVTSIDDIPLFEEIDFRGDSLFVTLTYSNKIQASTQAKIKGFSFDLRPHVAFVALKNGMHSSLGYAFFTEKISMYAPDDFSHVKNIHHTILNYFNDQIFQ